MAALADLLVDRLRGIVAAPTPDSPYLTYQEAADYCRCSPQTLRTARCKGRLSPVPGGAGARFTREELDRWMKSRPRRVARR